MLTRLREKKIPQPPNQVSVWTEGGKKKGRDPSGAFFSFAVPGTQACLRGFLRGSLAPVVLEGGEGEKKEPNSFSF